MSRAALLILPRSPSEHSNGNSVDGNYDSPHRTHALEIIGCINILVDTMSWDLHEDDLSHAVCQPPREHIAVADRYAGDDDALSAAINSDTDQVGECGCNEQSPHVASLCKGLLEKYINIILWVYIWFLGREGTFDNDGPTQEVGDLECELEHAPTIHTHATPLLHARLLQEARQCSGNQADSVDIQFDTYFECESGCVTIHAEAFDDEVCAPESTAIEGAHSKIPLSKKLPKWKD